jgi:IS5 family transposase
VILSAANVNDHLVLEEALDAIPSVSGFRPGRPRHRPVKLHADKAYDFEQCRRELKRRGIVPRIARRGTEDSQKLGRHRWVVERTLSWMARFRRLAIRWEQCPRIHLAFNLIAASLINLRFL